MDLVRLVSDACEQLTLKNAEFLIVAKPPYKPGVYALFHEGELRYVGVARGHKGLRNRKRNYVGGDDSHTTHRQFTTRFPDKPQRTNYIKNSVSMAWIVVPSVEEAEALERQLILRLGPEWNRVGKR